MNLIIDIRNCQAASKGTRVEKGYRTQVQNDPFFWLRFKKSLLKIQGIIHIKSDLQPRKSSLPEQAKVGFWTKIFHFQSIKVSFDAKKR